MTSLKTVITAFIFLASTASRAFGDHEQFIVGVMRNVDPSADIVSSVSGSCVPSHSRQRLDCYFTSFGLWKVKTEDQAKKDLDQLVQEINKDPVKQVREFKKSMCDDKKTPQPDPLLMKYNVSYRTIIGATKAFCEHPSRDSAMTVFRTMTESEIRKCHCVVNDWRLTFVREIDRWIANIGPSGLCAVINVFTLVPHDLKKVNTKTGPVLWTLHQKTVTTHRADDPLCANPTKNPLLPTITEGAMTVSWNAPSKTIECAEFEFTSALEGMSDPRGPKVK